MIERYTLPDMGTVWSEQHKYALWCRVETLVLEAHAAAGRVPADVIDPVRNAPPPTPERVAEIEETTQHDVIAFLTAWADNTTPRTAAAYVHHGMTSSDLLDTALAVQLTDATDVLLAKADLDRVPVRQAVVAQRRHQSVGLGQEDVGGVGELHGQCGVEQVRRRHAVVHVRGCRARLGVVGPRGEEGDDVVLRRLLDLRHPLRRRWRRIAHRLHDVGRHPPRGRVRLEHQGLHPAPEGVLVLVAPDPAHLGERVALDHRGTARSSSARRTTRTILPQG